ncbi:bifunctional diguanylate cyclase/phosphodiesterase [Paenibacillus caui]|uniref:sensor domain-containing protein n=1 Tax=Paenibacillus caui TaxID=2873927 RepID=UPI001CA8A9FE|nr:bifunctional diguanylate cyclase/phosphodiesterase [Paenibacillus caui]
MHILILKSVLPASSAAVLSRNGLAKLLSGLPGEEKKYQVYEFMSNICMGLVIALLASLALMKLYHNRLRKEVRAEREFAKEVLNHTDMLVWAVRPNGRTVYFNIQAEKLTGLSGKEMFASNFEQLGMAGSGFELLAGAMKEAMNFHLMDSREAIFTDPSGQEHCLLLRTSVVRNTAGQAEAFVLSGVKIMDRKEIERKLQKGYSGLQRAYHDLAETQAELRQQFEELAASQESLKISEERLYLAHEGSGAIIWEADFSTMDYYVSSRWYELLGYEEREDLYPEAELLALVHPDDAEEAEKARRDHLEGKTPSYNAEYRMRTGDGDYRWLQVRGKALRNEQGEPIRFAGSLIDITEQKNYELRLRSSYKELETTYGELAATQDELKQQYDLLVDSRDRLREKEEMLHKMAYYDSLSGLPNRVYLLEEMDRYFSSPGRKAALLFIDTDNFKNINDTLGHKWGDLLIREAGTRLKSLIPPEAIIFRLGGDEFVVLVKEAKGQDDVFQLAMQLVKGFKLPFTIRQSELHISISMGIAFYPEHANNPEELIKNADVALYHAKKSGKGSFRVYDHSMKVELLERMKIETHLLSALDHDEFQLYYQPQIDADCRKIIGFEALLRWDSPELGRVSPDKFIRIAEDSRLILAIGEWVLLTACAFLKKVHEQSYADCKISVNISVMQLKQEDFMETLSGILEEVGLQPEFLEIEITESIFMDSSDRKSLVGKLDQLRAMGIGIAMDDFGTGYSSLSYLRAFELLTSRGQEEA